MVCKMAKAAKGGSSVSKKTINPKKTVGRHAKSDSKNKNSKNYKKAYRGQGR